MSAIEQFDDGVEDVELDEVEDVVEPVTLRFAVYPLEALRDSTTLSKKAFKEQFTFWDNCHGTLWRKYDSEFVYDHLVRDLLKMGVDYHSAFVADTSRLFDIITNKSGEDRHAALTRVWAERRTDSETSTVHQAREQAFGWLKQRKSAPSTHTLSNTLHDYFAVQQRYMVLLHWTAVMITAFKTHWPEDDRVPALTGLLHELVTLDHSITNLARKDHVQRVYTTLHSL